MIESRSGGLKDGKHLRGSKRLGEGDELAAALAILEEFPLEGKVISADAGILKAPFVQKVVEKKGGISG
ncbi:MAG: hypothetical protein QXS54_10755 [Candidatus Methanomethylicaceae archaeon]